MSSGLPVALSAQPDAVRRHGNTSACAPSRAMTQTSRSISAGAIDTGSHLSGDDIAWAMALIRVRRAIALSQIKDAGDGARV